MLHNQYGTCACVSEPYTSASNVFVCFWDKGMYSRIKTVYVQSSRHVLLGHTHVVWRHIRVLPANKYVLLGHRYFVVADVLRCPFYLDLSTARSPGQVDALCNPLEVKLVGPRNCPQQPRGSTTPPPYPTAPRPLPSSPTHSAVLYESRTICKRKQSSDHVRNLICLTFCTDFAFQVT